MPPHDLADSLFDSSGRITSTGSANAYVIRVTTPIAGYHRGMQPIRFVANFSNTGSATANIATQRSPSGMGAKTLKKLGGAADLASGDIVSGGVYTLIYDGTNFQVLELTMPSSFTAGTISVGTAVNPASNDGAALGTSSLGWADLFLATGGLVDWAAGAAQIAGFASTGGITINADPGNTIANSVIALAVDGTTQATVGPTGVTVNTALLPDATDGAVLGGGSAQWADLFLASGGLIDWANGAATMGGFLSTGGIIIAADPGNAIASTSTTLTVDGGNKLRVDGTATATNTALSVFDVDNNALERVSVGAADSGGAGFKVLRIPN